MAKAMAEIGIDMAYRIPKTIDAAISHSPPEVIITMGCGEECPYVPGARRQDWDLPDPAGKSIEFMRDVLESRACHERGLFQRDYVQKMLANPDSVHTSINGNKLWHLAVLEFWLQRNVDIPA